MPRSCLVMKLKIIIGLLACLFVIILVAGLTVFIQNGLVITTTGESGTITITIRDVFGHSVSNALVEVGNMQIHIRDGSVGQEISLPLGVHELVINANGYRTYKKKISVTGEKFIDLKFETGLWPYYFQADFRVYYMIDYDEMEYAYAEIFFVNGTDEEYMLKKCWIEASNGKVIKNILAEEDDYKSFIGTYTDDNYVLNPEPAVVIKPKILYKTSPFNIEAPFNKNDEYFLVMVYASKSDFKQTRYSTKVLSDVMNLREN